MRPAFEAQTINLSADDGLVFNVLAPAGQRFCIDTSTNLVDWTLFSSILGAATNTPLSIPPRPGANRLFIRLRPE